MTSSSALARVAPCLQLRLRKTFALSLIVCLSASAVFVGQKLRLGRNLTIHYASLSEDQVDSRLQKAAVLALQQHEGTIIVIDPRNGRLRTVLNPEIAFSRAFAPGSTIKPFAALAAMRFGLTGSPLLCGENYSHRGFQTVCSHPRQQVALRTSEALAYSCNFYFAKLGERFKEPEFTTLLSDFGFGERSGINSERESTGKLGGEWRSQNVLGEGDYVQVTPIQLLMAYSALINGGRLLVPRIATVNDFNTRFRRAVAISEDEREVVFEGLRNAIRFGTAKSAALHSLPLNILGKTGTSTPLKGFRPQGWFVGFAAETENQSVIDGLGVLVFLKRGRGSEAAEVSRKIFEEYALAETAKGRMGEWETRGRGDDFDNECPDSPHAQISLSPLPPFFPSHFLSISASPRLGVPVSPRLRVPVSPSLPFANSPIRVYLNREKTIRAVPLENYLLGVVASEGSIETKVEALKALAVASRTYTIRNLRRHASQGFDFCDTTHCQLFKPVGNDTRRVVVEAVDTTEGEVLKDRVGNVAEAYFSASCGGETANIAKLWGSRSRAYLSGVNDEYCETMPHSRWTDVISSTELSRALRTDVRADIGGELKDIFVSRRDRTGRAEQLTIVGSRHRTISGWDFKLIIGRALGWNLLKSSRFHLERAGRNFVFRGSGFGHGLGLCQEGAHIMAERGFGYRQILTKYFPGTVVVSDAKVYSADLLWSTSHNSIQEQIVAAERAIKGRGGISSEHFRISYPLSIGHRDAEYLLQLMEDTRRALLTRPSLPATARLPFIEVFVNETTGDFIGRTGLPSWAAAGNRGDRIELQPIALLKRRGILETTLRHELVHKVIDMVGKGRTQRWLAEGLAVYLAGEGRMVSRFQPKTSMSTAYLEEKLAAKPDADEMRALYAAAYTQVRNLIRLEGEAAIWQRVSRAEN